MRELRTCDFCAADAVGTFEIVPPELEPTEAEQRRVVCCPDCRDRLETLLEPLLARAGVTDRDSTDNSRPAGDSVVTAADSATTTRSRTASSNATVTDAATDGSTASDAYDPESADSEADADAAESSADADEPNSDTATLDGGITLERDEQPDETVDDTANETADDIVDDTTDQASSSASRPRAYSKVIRLLRNREFPMKRSAVEELASGAYDLENDTAAAIVDYAIEDGEFVENRGKLRRP
ncbi:hypothetical protein ACFR99_17390 [Haloarchaeobius amylolyticus]|uniref:Uncharacterized protein n=1 Tax=Haloarchaeobius amylolyticus TaxID=1198296 RepID=A0ABD6BL57_9EURY